MSGEDQAAAGVRIRQTDDVRGVIALGVAAGLTETEHDMEGIVALWGAYDGERLVGSIVLRRFSGLDLVGWLAVAEPQRGAGLGRRLLVTLEQEARRRDATRLWATARAPGFFLHHGFRIVDDGPERDALLSSCLSCDQYGTVCTPQAVAKDLVADDVGGR